MKSRTENECRPVHTFEFGGPAGETFLLDGQPFQLRGAELHPQRIPKAYWAHRIRLAKAMGLNTISMYVFWSDLERPDGSLDTASGSRDIGGFLELCAREGMWVLFRPGPYVCGEWDFGGLPVRLLKDADCRIRTLQDANFMTAQTRYLEQIAEVARPYLLRNGGTIIMTQIENEHGSWPRKDREYLLWLHDFWTRQGFGPLYMADGAADTHLSGIVIPGVAVGLDPALDEAAWDCARRHNPGVPIFSAETYPGWLRHWGEGAWQPSDRFAKDLRWFMEAGKSFCLYVFHGGTNFGFSAGANSGGPGNYEPDLTSYDYAAPVDEQGRPTAAYHELRAIIAAFVAEPLLPVPGPIPTMTISAFTPAFFANLADNTEAVPGAPHDRPPYFEAFGQNQGMAIYRTRIAAGGAADLVFEHFNDYGHVLLDGKHMGTLDRRNGGKTVRLPARVVAADLELVVEAMGHINFHAGMESDRKGVYGRVLLDGAELGGWSLAAKPLTEESVVKARPAVAPDERPGGHFRGTFRLETTADVFFDMSGYVKGTLYINGHNLGRYWKVGPQLGLYCPAGFLEVGENTVDVIDLELKQPAAICGESTAKYAGAKTETRNRDNQW